MNPSRVVFGTIVCALFATAVAGCQVQASVKTKTRYVEPNITQTDTADWTGQPINIRIEGVGVSVNGGVRVVADASVTKVTATARFLAMAFEDEKSNADQSIVEAKATFQITNTPSGITVSCGHGGAHGSSNAGESGCELAEIRVPAGTAQQKLNITVAGGNGDVDVNLGSATITNVGVNNNGSGATTASIPSTVGANVSLVSNKSGDITVTLPSNWAADKVTLQADADKITNAFADLTTYDGTTGRGAQGTGLADLKVTSKEFAGSTGNIALR
jgi:hypothetical protein